MSILVTERGPEPPRITPSVCNVRVLDKNYAVYGYPGEGWFELLSQTGTAEGTCGYNANGLRGLVKPNAVCLDVGASYGLITLALAQLAPQGKIYAFEPDEPSYKALTATIAAAEPNNITPAKLIIGRDNAVGRFVQDDQWRSSCHFIPDPNGNDLSASIDSLGWNRVDFIKIDAEGSELDILAGAATTIERFRPTVVMEFNSFALIHYRDIAPRAALKAIMSMFQRVSYFDRTQRGRITPLNDPEAFLRANLLTGFVDDLVCN